MKMDMMVKREDFYGICEDTLEEYFSQNGRNFAITSRCHRGKAFAYAYERLNAIISKAPSRKVMDFLKTEYHIKGSLLRKLIVKLYLIGVFHSNGIFADRVLLSVPDKIEMTDMLIYPCSKKIRIFHFDRGVVDVIVKNGFPCCCIKKEIKFRKRHSGPNINPVLCSGDNWYRERIIDGKPLARITDLGEYELLREESMNILENMTKKYGKAVNAAYYIKRLTEKIRSKTFLSEYKSSRCKESLLELTEHIRGKLSFPDENITLTLSHGDFHHGNIWVENTSRRIVFIDWETYGYRSEWYDKVTLLGGLRENGGISGILSPANLQKAVEYLQCRDMRSAECILLLVILEDILFRLEEAQSMPGGIGTPGLEAYCKSVMYSMENWNAGVK